MLKLLTLAIILTPFIIKESSGRPQQGMEIYGNKVFVLEDGGNVNVYRFRKGKSKLITSFPLASSCPDNHANNAEFGVETKPGASFPLLYVSVGKVACDIEWTCYVESILCRQGKYESELVQKIVLDTTAWTQKGYERIFGAPSWLVDRERGFLWVFSAQKRTTPKVTKSASENKYIATKFRIPLLSEGEIVRFDADDILDQVVFPFDVWFTQAGCIVDGKIFYCFGVGANSKDRPAAIRVYDTDTGCISARYDLSDDCLMEPEDIVVKDGYIYLNTASKTGDPVIYRMRYRVRTDCPVPK